MSIEKAKHAISREVWCLYREPIVTEWGRGFIAGLVRSFRELSGDWKIDDQKISEYWGCKEWNEPPSAVDTKGE